MLTKPCERSFAGAQDDSGRFRRTVVGSRGQWTVQEDREEWMRTDMNRRRTGRRAGCKTVILSGAKHLYIIIEMGLFGVKDPSLALRMTVDGSGGQRGVDEREEWMTERSG